jgi:AraC-like DNA-binding protein
MPNVTLPRPPRSTAPHELRGAYFTPVLAQYFSMLELTCSLVWIGDRNRWNLLVPFAHAPTMVEFEVNHFDQVNVRRQAYNDEHIDRSTELRRLVVGEIAGFSDFFLPVVESDQVTAHMVCGPFRRRALSAQDIEAQWREVSRDQTLGTERELLDYARCALNTTFLDGPLFAACEQLLRAIAAIMGGAPDPALITERFIFETVPLLESSPATVFRIARDMVDRDWSSVWRHPKMAWNFSVLGIEHMFTHAIAVAFEPRANERLSALERLVRAHEMQRHAIAVARELDDTIAGKLGDYGAFFLTACEPGARDSDSVAGRAAAIRERMRERFGADVVAGLSTPTPAGEELPRCYEEAVLALNAGLNEQRSVVKFKPRASETGATENSAYRAKLSELRGAVVAGAARAVEIAAFSVAESVLFRTRGNLDAMRASFEELMLQILESVEARVGFDAKTVRVLETTALRSLSEARSVDALAEAFQNGCARAVASVEHPGSSSRDARLEGARRYIDANLHLPLTLKDAARAAGFSERYFSTLFAGRFGTTFERYLAARRLERARELLLTTALPVARVVRAAGFGTPEHFFRAFKRAHGLTPEQYRKRGAELPVAYVGPVGPEL